MLVLARGRRDQAGREPIPYPAKRWVRGHGAASGLVASGRLATALRGDRRSRRPAARTSLGRVAFNGAPPLVAHPEDRLLSAMPADMPNPDRRHRRRCSLTKCLDSFMESDRRSSWQGFWLVRRWRRGPHPGDCCRNRSRGASAVPVPRGAGWRRTWRHTRAPAEAVVGTCSPQPPRRTVLSARGSIRVAPRRGTGTCIRRCLCRLGRRYVWCRGPCTTRLLLGPGSAGGFLRVA